VYNSRRPLDRPFALFTLSFDLWPNISWWARYRDGLSPCQVWWMVIVVSVVLVLSCRQTDRQNHRQTRVLTRLLSAWVMIFLCIDVMPRCVRYQFHQQMTSPFRHRLSFPDVNIPEQQRQQVVTTSSASSNNNYYCQPTVSTAIGIPSRFSRADGASTKTVYTWP